MSENTLPFAYVAERDGHWVGVITGEPDRPKELKKFYSEFAGCKISQMATREDWLSYIKTTPAFGRSAPPPQRMEG